MESIGLRLRFLLVVFVFGAVLLVAVLGFSAQVGTFLGSTLTSNVLLVALITVDGFLGLYAILEERSRRYFLQVKEDVLERWDARENLGGVREDQGELSRADPKDPTVFTDLPPRIQQKFKQTYSELWQAWEDAKSRHLGLNEQLEKAYQELQKATRAILEATPIREIDRQVLEPPWLDSPALFHAVLEGARERQKFARGIVFLDDEVEGYLKSGGYVIVRGATEERHALKVKLDAFLESERFRELASRLVRQTSEVRDSSRAQAFESERGKTIARIKWKHPGK